MSEMVERVARALAWEADKRFRTVDPGFAALKEPDPQAYVDRAWPKYASDARAVIAAMREPTEGMCRAYVHAEQREMAYGMEPKDAWRAMIDEALGK